MATIMNSSLAMAPKDEQAYWEANFWEALETRDTHMDGVFFFAVITTGVYCRPSCPSRRPRRENGQARRLFKTARSACALGKLSSAGGARKRSILRYCSSLAAISPTFTSCQAA